MDVVAPGTGTLIGALCGFRAGDLITNIVLHVTANGSSITLAKVGVYDLSGVLLASSADVDTTFSSGSVPRKQVTALSSPYRVIDDRGLYVAFLNVNGGGSPTILRGNDNNSAQIGSGGWPYWSQTGQTDLPATATPASATNAPWMGVS